MQFTNEVNWTTSDFVMAGGLRFGSGLMSEVVMRKTTSRHRRLAIIAALLLIAILIWIALGVGIFGTSF
jgi:uncharacterized membrane protein YoaT (DUF817 family)